MADNDTTQATLPPADIPQMSTRDTKADILAAYQELVKRYETGAVQAKDKERAVQKTKEESIIRQASGYTVEKIVQGCGNLEAAARSWLRDLSESLTRESKKLQEIQGAIRLEEAHLKEVHDITVAAETLAELIETHRTKEREFEKNKQQKMEEWRREGEEHDYVLAQRRKREEDAYAEKCAAQEKELADRKQAIIAEEQEMKALRKRAESFDGEVQTAAANATKLAEETVRREEKVKADLLAQNVLREKEIAALKIASLEEKIAGLTADAASLKSQLASASRESKEIALKVIEGASSLQNLRRVQAMDRGEAA
ncbi:hypothetical protein COU79_02650 [Candidatus Peregrinibacteria bacterium CG10_big_fil_rev_8_21_14_0_10_54_7]|nr:MAG: hypothetical protein COU79_02650 [Candidatus Peregrinibacteria bacterium CG10_big_fil_rev_8_21_14_0_10_54_7]